MMKDFYAPICDPSEDSFESAFDAIDDFDINTSDLSEWLNDEHGPGLSLSEEPVSKNTALIDDTTVISIDRFDDNESTYTPSKRRRSSPSPPRRRLRQYSPPRNNFIPSVPEDKEYNDAMSKLAASIQRSELSRAASTRSSPQPSPSTLSSFAGLLTGKRTSLTVGLEHSRRQLRTFMSQIIANQPF